jgi:hypothetical protein
MIGFWKFMAQWCPAAVLGCSVAEGFGVARAKSPAETLLTSVLAQAITPSLKAVGFRKSGMNYHRRHGEVVQVVNIQVSQGSTWAEKEFYVNVGIAFDAICNLAGVLILDRPKEYDCDIRGTRDRIARNQTRGSLPTSGKRLQGIAGAEVCFRHVCGRKRTGSTLPDDSCVSGCDLPPAGPGDAVRAHS